MKWDYIIIGAGSAGCALAHQLVERSGKTVLVLEAGGRDRSPFIKFPAAVSQAARRFDWGYQAQPDPTRHGLVERWLRGRVLGGSSSVNGTKYVRAAAEDFERWSAHCGHAGKWSAADIMPIFREIETSDRDGASRGHTGPLYVRTVKRPHFITQAFVESACAAGHLFNTDYNDGSQEGVAYAQFSQRRGFRCSAADAFLKPVLNRKNIKLLLHAVVERIEVENGRAAAVVFQRNGKSSRISAYNIILCAGAINSPKILMLSGIGDAVELKRHGIGVVQDLPAVGRYFKDQPLLRLTYRTKIPTYNLTQGLGQKLAIAAKFIRHGEGPISNLFEGVVFLKTSELEPIPDLRLTFLAIGATLMPDGTSRFTPYPAVAVSLIKSYPRSSGSIRLASSNPSDAPLIDCPLFEHTADIETLVAGIREVRRIMSCSPIADLVEEEVSPGVAVHTPDALEDFIRRRAVVAFHSVGTCRMGIETDAVVDPDLRVRGVENLWVADASIMPYHISADTNATCMMVGAKLGKQLRG